MKFASIIHCRRCGHRFRHITKFQPELDDPTPPCPNLACGEASDPIGMDLSLNTAPASIGGNIHVKAVDETARIVMEEHGMTDLRDDVRPGETMAPKLHPQLQAKADNFFGGPRVHRNSRGFNPGMHAAAAMQGAFVDRGSTAASIEAVHRNRVTVPTHTAASYNPRR